MSEMATVRMAATQHSSHCQRIGWRKTFFPSLQSLTGSGWLNLVLMVLGSKPLTIWNKSSAESGCLVCDLTAETQLPVGFGYSLPLSSHNGIMLHSESLSFLLISKGNTVVKSHSLIMREGECYRHMVPLCPGFLNYILYQPSDITTNSSLSMWTALVHLPFLLSAKGLIAREKMNNPCLRMKKS